MTRRSHRGHRLAAAGVTACLALGLVPAEAAAQSDRRAREDRYEQAIRAAAAARAAERQAEERRRQEAERRIDRRREEAAYRAGQRAGAVGGAVANELRHRHRRRHYHGVIIVRPHGHWYPGYGHHRHDRDALRFLAFTAITLKLLDMISEEQQRAHEAAQIRATMAAIGERITWRDGNASGSVTAIRQGSSSEGYQCREFRQEIQIGGRFEEAYGTACLQPDGAWKIVND